MNKMCASLFFLVGNLVASEQSQATFFAQQAAGNQMVLICDKTGKFFFVPAYFLQNMQEQFFSTQRESFNDQGKQFYRISYESPRNGLYDQEWRIYRENQAKENRYLYGCPAKNDQDLYGHPAGGELVGKHKKTRLGTRGGGKLEKILNKDKKEPTLEELCQLYHFSPTEPFVPEEFEKTKDCVLNEKNKESAVAVMSGRSLWDSHE